MRKDEDFHTPTLQLTNEGIKTPRVSELDTFRVMAMLYVVYAHCAEAFVHFGGPKNLFYLDWIRTHPTVGVELFFVLSGYLVGGPLLRELKASGTIDVTRFWIRRALRIWPLYYFALFSTLAAYVLTGHVWSFRNGVLSGLFLVNYFDDQVLGDGWSISTEEQFYILVPFALLALTLAVRKWGQLFKRLLLPLVFLAPLIRIGELSSSTLQGPWRGIADHPWTLLWNFHSHFDGLLVGLIIAWPRDGRSNWAQRSSAWKFWAILVVSALLAKVSEDYFPYTLGPTVVSLAMGAWVYFVTEAKPRRMFGNGFSHRYWSAYARLTYGVYLWHLVLLGPIYDFCVYLIGPIATGNEPCLRFLFFCLMELALASILAFVTYAAIEKPSLRYRDSAQRSLSSCKRQNLRAMAVERSD